LGFGEVIDTAKHTNPFSGVRKRVAFGKETKREEISQYIKEKPGQKRRGKEKRPKNVCR